MVPVESGLRRDLVTAVVAFAVGAAFLVVLTQQPWSQTRWQLGPVALVCVGLVFRRSAPLVALPIGTAAVVAHQILVGENQAGPALATPLIYTQILYDACLYGSRRLSRLLLWGAAAVTLAAACAGLIWFSPTDGALLGFVAGLFTVLPVMTALEVRHHREQAESERLRAEQVSRLAELDHRTAVAAERTRMARELHDLVANHLSAIAVQSTAALAVRSEQADAARRALTVIRENSVQGLNEMRRMIGLLREGDGDSEPATTAPRLAEIQPLLDAAGESGMAARLRIDGEARPLPAAVDLAAYRVVQESLTNAVKHAAPGEAEVAIRYRPDRVTITVDSSGAGRSRVPGSGAGLIGMGERAALLDGTFTAGPHAGGWRVQIEFPIGDEAR